MKLKRQWQDNSAAFSELRNRITEVVHEYKRESASMDPPVVLVIGQSEARTIREEMDICPMYFANQPPVTITPDGSIEGMHLQGLRVVVTNDNSTLRVV